jgi:hypothetical protein
VLKAQINKTDRNDARGIAQMMRVGLHRPVHVKTLRSQKLRMLLTHRKLLQFFCNDEAQADIARSYAVSDNNRQAELMGLWAALAKWLETSAARAGSQGCVARPRVAASNR